MNGADIILTVLIGAAFLLAMRKVIRDRKYGRSCCGGGTGCSCGCGGTCSGGSCTGCGRKQDTGREIEAFYEGQQESAVRRDGNDTGDGSGDAGAS